MKRLIPLLFILLMSGRAYAELPAWQVLLEEHFDIVETFDQLQDWAPTLKARAGNVQNQNIMPKKLDGSPSIWNSFDYWGSEPIKDMTWIGNHGVGNAWRSSKSLCIDLGNEFGPPRLRTFFGSNEPDEINPFGNYGIVESGYRRDVFFFYMVKYPPGAFPLKEGGGYDWFLYKFHVLASGFTSSGSVQEGNLAYGATNLHTQLSPRSGGITPQLRHESEARWDVSRGYQWFPSDNVKPDGFIDAKIESNNWWGVEVRFHSGTPGVSDAFYEFWSYDPDGTAYYGGKSPLFMAMPAEKDWGYTLFFFGGNRKYFDDNPSHYWVDDFIIHGDRIGPTYFALLNEGSLTCEFDPAFCEDQTACEEVPGYNWCDTYCSSSTCPTCEDNPSLCLTEYDCENVGNPPDGWYWDGSQCISTEPTCVNTASLCLTQSDCQTIGNNGLGWYWDSVAEECTSDWPELIPNTLKIRPIGGTGVKPLTFTPLDTSGAGRMRVQ
jgi:hypothetical protein